MRDLRAKKGFTLIELLVVVAIIALLISILLPSLRDAKEQAKIAKCLSGLRNLMTSTILYFQDYNDAFPFYTVGGGGGVCTWSYGGKTSDEYWKSHPDYGDLFYIPSQHRPLNEYVMGGDMEPDLYEGGQLVKRTEVPTLECPGDRTSHQRFWDSATEAVQISSYDDIGTSYHFNMHAISDTNIDEWQNNGAGWTTLVRALVKDTMGGMVATLTFYHEDPMDYALDNEVERLGNHRKLSKHTVGFLDGHADYKLMDTRDHCGVGWQSINPNWVYKFGMQRPPIYYDLPGKNCDPKNH